MSDTKIIATKFYEWEGDACRVHEDEIGNLTADIYRGGVGFIPMPASDVIWKSKSISEQQYKKLVTEEITRNHRANNNDEII